MSNQNINAEKKLLIHCLTLSRVPFSILFDILLLYGQNSPFLCSILFFIIALTDFFDGKLARYYHVESKKGALLDVGTDFFFIVTASSLLYAKGLLPFGLIVIIVLKFTEFCLTSYRFNIDKALFFDAIGRFTAVVLYAVPPTIVIFHSLLHRTLFDSIVFSVFIAIGLLSLVSFCIRVFKIMQYRVKI